MLIYIRIPESLKKSTDELISRRLYPDFNTIVTVALQNLCIAEEEAAQNPALKPPPVPAQAAAASANTITAPSASVKIELPKAAQWDGSVSISEKLIVPFPADLFRPDQCVPVEKWVFGQQNRVLPVKINSRLLIALIAERGSEVELFEAANEISTRAAQVFEFLNGLDRRFGHGKDDLLSTGFPEPGSEKAISRYANHFAAYESTQGNLTGMLIQWKFVGIKRVKNKTYLLPTKACLDFAALANPLMDHPVTAKPNEKFNQEEVAWAIEHINKHVPVEASAFTTILNGLREGFTTPDTIDGFLRKHAKEKADVSSAFISTQRSGAVSRMSDLNLVKRQRDGTKVAYHITELGNKWLKSLNGNSK
jgi:hypothetical protein